MEGMYVFLRKEGNTTKRLDTGMVAHSFRVGSAFPSLDDWSPRLLDSAVQRSQMILPLFCATRRMPMFLCHIGNNVNKHRIGRTG